MKIRMTVTIDVDPDTWMAEYGCERRDVRDNVGSYFESLLQDSPARSADIVKDIDIKR